MKEYAPEPATISDAQEISNLYRTVWTPYRKKFPQPLMDSRIPDAGQVADEIEKLSIYSQKASLYTRSMADNEYYIIRNSENIVGVVRCQFPHGTCHLDRMVVHPDHRKKGIGRALTGFIINLARERNAAKVWLDTTPALEEAVNLYLSMGFKEVGHFEKHYWGQDIKFYELIL